MTKPPAARVYAAVYSCAERSIRNYRQEGAPLDNPAAMFAWWASRKNMPRSVATKGLDAIQAAFDAVIGPSVAIHSPEKHVPPTAEDSPTASTMQDDLPAGAEHELRWLADLAVEARRNLIRAHKGGNPVVQKQALDSYLKITEGLRKFDNQVATDRRDSGEMITRAQVEQPIIAITVWLRRGIEDFINTACLTIAEADTPQKVYAVAADPLRRSLYRAVDAACSDGKFPLWMKEAFETGLGIRQ